ncbi:MAG TPA: glycosyltransferase [Stellaceae bacterium]|nr:glycosyltransferase [Stellaceae bacterium]
MVFLDQALRAASPRYSPPPTPLASVLIHGAVVGLWVGLFVSAFWLHGLFAWSVGVVYVVYDTALLLFVTWQTRELWRLRPATPLTGAHGSVGVIVAAYNEAAVLPITLATLLEQTAPPDQILIADDGSTDETPAMLRRLYGLLPPAIGTASAPSPDHPSLRWVRLPHAGKARALNGALLLMETDTVITVDADTLLDRKAIGVMRHAFSSEPQLVAATGVLTPVCGPSTAGRVLHWFQTYEYIRNFLSRYAWARVDSLLLISGAFAGFRRQALLDVGGFDPDCLVEDYELIHRLRRYGATHRLGWRTAVLGRAQARTAAPSTLATFLRQRGRWFGGFLQTQYWYRDMVGDRRYGWLGIAMLPVKAIDTLQPIYGLSALVVLFAHLLTGRLSIVGLIAGVIGIKLAIDLTFHLWSIHLYRRWVGGQTGTHLGYAVLAALAEPFSFQILRHGGAALGWLLFLTGRRGWGRQSRLGLVAEADPVSNAPRG